MLFRSEVWLILRLLSLFRPSVNRNGIVVFVVPIFLLAIAVFNYIVISLLSAGVRITAFGVADRFLCLNCGRLLDRNRALIRSFIIKYAFPQQTQSHTQAHAHARDEHTGGSGAGACFCPVSLRLSGCNLNNCLVFAFVVRSCFIVGGRHAVICCVLLCFTIQLRLRTIIWPSLISFVRHDCILVSRLIRRILSFIFVLQRGQVIPVAAVQL